MKAAPSSWQARRPQFRLATTPQSPRPALGTPHCRTFPSKRISATQRLLGSKLPHPPSSAAGRSSFSDAYSLLLLLWSKTCFSTLGGGRNGSPSPEGLTTWEGREGQALAFEWVHIYDWEVHTLQEQGQESTRESCGARQACCGCWTAQWQGDKTQSRGKVFPEGPGSTDQEERTSPPT